jgi:hypothetical protein
MDIITYDFSEFVDFRQTIGAGLFVLSLFPIKKRS